MSFQADIIHLIVYRNVENLLEHWISYIILQHLANLSDMIVTNKGPANTPIDRATGGNQTLDNYISAPSSS